MVVNDRWSLNTGDLLIQEVLQKELSVVVNDRWSLNTGGHMSRFYCTCITKIKTKY